MKLKRFLDTKAPLANGHKRDSLLMMPDHKFESNHGFTQWAVPTAEKSNHNFNAPVLDLGSAIWLAERKDVSKFFENMSVRFLEFLKRNDHWKSLYEHNHLRVSRAIDSLRPLHSWELADWFYAKVKAFADSSYELMSDARTQWGRKASVEHDRIAGAFQTWGHVITANKHYTKKIDGVSVKMLIENWLSDAGQTALVKH